MISEKTTGGLVALLSLPRFLVLDDDDELVFSGRTFFGLDDRTRLDERVEDMISDPGCTGNGLSETQLECWKRMSAQPPALNATCHRGHLTQKKFPLNRPWWYVFPG